MCMEDIIDLHARPNLSFPQTPCLSIQAVCHLNVEMSQIILLSYLLFGSC